MKKSFAFVIGVVSTVAALQGIAGTQSSQSATSPTVAPLPAEQQGDLSTSGRNWTAQTGSLIPPLTLDRQGIQSWGVATQPGPRNEHMTPPHGGRVAVGDRFNLPGRE